MGRDVTELLPFGVFLVKNLTIVLGTFHLIAAGTYDKESVGASIRPICTRCWITMIYMIQVFHSSRLFIVNPRPSEIVALGAVPRRASAAPPPPPPPSPLPSAAGGAGHVRGAGASVASRGALPMRAARGTPPRTGEAKPYCRIHHDLDPLTSEYGTCRTVTTRANVAHVRESRPHERR